MMSTSHTHQMAYRWWSRSGIITFQVLESVLEDEKVAVENNCQFYSVQNGKIWDTTTHAETGAPHNECTAMKCTAFKYTNGIVWFGTQLWQMDWTPHENNVQLCPPLLASPSLLASSQLSLIFLRQTAARAMSSTSRHTARPMVTHRATGGNAMFWPEAEGRGRGTGEREPHYLLLQS